MNIFSASGVFVELYPFFLVLAIILILAYIIVVPICVATIADKQGRNGVGWFFLSFLINPFFAILVLIALGDTKAKRLEKVMEEEWARNSVRESISKNSQGVNNNQRQETDHSRYMPH